MIISEILRKLFKLPPPYCEACDALDATIEILKQQLECERFENRELIRSLMSLYKPQVEERAPSSIGIDPIKPRSIPWVVKRETLEAEDRVKAQLLRDKATEMSSHSEIIKDVEQQLGIN